MKVIIIGGAAGGMGVSAKLRRNLPNAEIVVYQKEKYVSLGPCGLPYFVSDNFSDPNEMIARTVKEFEKSNIKINVQTVVNNVDFKNKKISYLDKKGQENFDTYDHLVITTGAYPIIPPISGINEAQNVFTLTRLEDGINLKNFLQNKDIKNVAILGSGFIGLEMCETLGQLNKKIYLIEKENVLTSKQLDLEFSEKIEAELTKKEINFIKNDFVIETILDDKKMVNRIKLKSGKEIPIDALIVAAGFAPATDFIKNSEIKLSENGAIIVDESGHTNIKNVWSCGDCATTYNRLTKKNSYTALATVPRKFSKIVADNISGDKKRFAGTLNTGIIRLFDLEIARTGLSENEAKNLGIDYKTVLINDKDHTNYLPNQADLTLKLMMNNKTKTLIGAQIGGTNQAVMRIHSLITMIWNQIKVDDDLEQIDLPYAPPFSRPVDIIHLALSKLNKK